MMSPLITQRPGGTMRTRTTTALVGVLLLGLAACSSGNDDKQPTAAPTASSSTTRAFDEHDCKALLERNYEADAARDASTDPECSHLTRDQYVAAVGEVLANHKDDFLEDATNEIAWDSAWEQTASTQQEVVCDRLKTDGVEAVAAEMAEGKESPSGDEAAMAQYFLDEKCSQS